MSKQELKDLDKWIAVHMFGWQERQAHCGSEVLKGRSFWVNDKCQTVLSESGTGNHTFPKFTSDQALAFELLEKLSYGKIISILYNNQTWTVDNLRGAAPWEEIEVQAQTLPLALCLFAQKMLPVPPNA